MGLTVYANGQPTAYLSASVSASMKDASRHFSLTLTQREAGLYPGAQVTILGDSGQVIFTGYSNTYEASFDANSHTITVTGRSTIQDKLDSSVTMQSQGQHKQKTPVEIANTEGSDYGGSYVDKVGMSKLDQFHVNNGEKVHQCARRLAQQFNCTIRGTADGNAEFCTAETATRGGVLSEGLNILSARGSLDDSQNYSEFEVKSSLAGRKEKYGDEASKLAAKASGSASRTRRLTSIVDRSQDKAQSQKQAEWLARQTEQKSKSVSITVQGDAPSGAVVDTNVIYTVISPWLGLAQDMLVESCTWKTDDGGTSTQMSMVAPEAYGGKSSAASQRSAATADTVTDASGTTSQQPSPMAPPTTLGQQINVPSFGEF